MSSINDVRLVGRLTKDPEFATAGNGKRLVRLAVETEKFVKIGGESKRIAQTHAVVCFNQFSLEPLKEFGRRGTWVKVLGELTYGRDGKAEVMVPQYGGECGLMTAIPGPGGDAPAAEPERDSQPSRTGSGGLGRLPRSTDRNGDDESPGERAASRSYDRTSRAALQDSLEDDDIPF